MNAADAFIEVTHANLANFNSQFYRKLRRKLAQDSFMQQTKEVAESKLGQDATIDLVCDSMNITNLN